METFTELAGRQVADRDLHAAKLRAQETLQEQQARQAANWEWQAQKRAAKSPQVGRISLADDRRQHAKQCMELQANQRRVQREVDRKVKDAVKASKAGS